MKMNAVITGAGRGIGKAIALTFAKEGFNLALCSKNKNNLHHVVKEIRDKFPTVEIIAFPCDIAVKPEVLRFAAIVNKEWKKTDVLVNNAGIFQPGQIHKEEDGMLEEMLGTNLFGAYHLTRALIKKMIRQKSGHVFNICSIASIEAYPDGGAYCISKHALYGFSKVLREEMKPYNIGVTAVLPGATYTDSWKGSKLPKTRFMQPQDVADAILSAYRLSPGSVVEEIILRPMKGDI